MLLNSRLKLKSQMKVTLFLDYSASGPFSNLVTQI